MTTSGEGTGYMCVRSSKKKRRRRRRRRCRFSMETLLMKFSDKLGNISSVSWMYAECGSGSGGGDSGGGDGSDGVKMLVDAVKGKRNVDITIMT